MTQEEVAILWKDANGWDVKGYETTLKDLERFAKLVAAKATAVEREACAKLAEEYGTWGGSGFYEWFKKLGVEIRARGEA
jgi:hypothetical protein